MLNLIVLFFSVTVFLYAGLGVYVLNKNPNDRSNQIFAMLMLVFMIWSIGIYNINLIASDETPTEILPAVKIQFSGMILVLAVFVILSFPDKKNAKKNPIMLLILLFSLYIIDIIWTTDITHIGIEVFSMISENLKEYFLLSSMFGVAGIFLLLRYYINSIYRQPDQEKLITAGAIIAVIVSLTANIILPMVFNMYLIGLTTFAPAIMGIFFAYAVYQYGFCIRPVPEISPTSFCGVNCITCIEYVTGKCRGCRFEKDRYMNCDIRICLAKKGHLGCGECTEIVECNKRKERGRECFELKKKLVLPHGAFLVKDKGYEILLDSTKMGALSIVITAVHPSKTRHDHGLRTSSIVWIANDPEAISPEKLGRLGLMLANSMKKLDDSGGGVILLDAVKELVEVNGLEKVLGFIKLLDRAAIEHKVTLLIACKDREFEGITEKGIEYLKF